MVSYCEGSSSEVRSVDVLELGVDGVQLSGVHVAHGVLVWCTYIGVHVAQGVLVWCTFIGVHVAQGVLVWCTFIGVHVARGGGGGCWCGHEWRCMFVKF